MGRKFYISEFKKRNSAQCEFGGEYTWSDIIKRLEKTLRTKETAAEYAAMTTEQRTKAKDIGSFIAGGLIAGRRTKTAVQFRSMVTLDLDDVTMTTADLWAEIDAEFICALAVYSTHSHTPEKPRLRLVIPTSRDMSPEEYEPVARWIASKIGIEQFDGTAYRTNQLMFWPSTPKDAEYYFMCKEGNFLDPDEVLSKYQDWRDCSVWPVSSREGELAHRDIKQAGEPTEKPGLIGAFCRTYSIEDVIEIFLSDIYEPTTTDGRYTYKPGTTSGGVVTYNGKFAFSHHDTDPASRQLCNAFDFVRLHKFGPLDEGSRATDVTRLPSYAAMTEFAGNDKNVRLLMAREREQSAANDFEAVEVPEDYNDEWKLKLEKDKKEKPVSTAANIILILENDPALRGKLSRDLFAGVDVVGGKLPWPKSNEHGNQWTDTDDANLRIYLERCYGITGKQKIDDALSYVVNKHSHHPIRDYLNALSWDGVPRLERLIIDYIGAEDNELNRAMTRKHFTAAVARVMQPGCKYDYCLVLTGPEGVGKSTLLTIMGGEWFNDSVTTTEGKEGMECLRRAWIVEMGELSSIKRSDVESIKAYLSKRVDIYRAAYAKRTAEQPRQCVFCGTTNEALFLKGETGNRRFWIINVDPAKRKFENWREAIERDRDQLWAEAVHNFKQGEKLYLSAELETQARQRQGEHNLNTEDPTVEALRKFLEMLLPETWYDKNGTWRLVEDARRTFVQRGPECTKEPCTIKRDKFCAAEFVKECLGLTERDGAKYKQEIRFVNQIMKNDFPEWEALKSIDFPAPYGKQRGFKRKSKTDTFDDADL